MLDSLFLYPPPPSPCRTSGCQIAGQFGSYAESNRKRRGKMITLIIHAPYRKSKNGRIKKSFETIFEDGLGPAHAISKKDVIKLTRGSKVVLLRKTRNKERRAEGRLVELVDTGKTVPQGVRQYDVYFKDQKIVDYKPEKLNRFGVAVI
jgi:hypothetical protein